MYCVMAGFQRVRGLTVQWTKLGTVPKLRWLAEVALQFQRHATTGSDAQTSWVSIAEIADRVATVSTRTLYLGIWCFSVTPVIT